MAAAAAGPLATAAIALAAARVGKERQRRGEKETRSFVREVEAGVYIWSTRFGSEARKASEVQ